MASFKYHITDSTGVRIESDIPELEQAETYRQFLLDNHPHETYTIEQERIYRIKGLGRDPDLH